MNKLRRQTHKKTETKKSELTWKKKKTNTRHKRQFKTTNIYKERKKKKH